MLSNSDFKNLLSDGSLQAEKLRFDLKTIDKWGKEIKAKSLQKKISGSNNTKKADSVIKDEEEDDRPIYRDRAQEVICFFISFIVIYYHNNYIIIIIVRSLTKVRNK